MQGGGRLAVGRGGLVFLVLPSGFWSHLASTIFLLEEACPGLGRTEMLPVQLSAEDRYS